MNPQYVTILTAVIAGICGSGVTGLIQFLIQRHDRKEEDKDEKYIALQNGVMVILKDRFIFLCSKHIKNNYITIDEFAELKEMHNAYTALGGNGTGTEYWNKVEQLPRVAD